MDMELLQHLSAEQKDKYAKLDRLFGSEGWELVMQWARLNFDEASLRCATVNTWEENRVAVGQRLAFYKLGTLAETTENEFTELAAQAREAAVNSATSVEDFE
jgi:hypothetical protein